MQHIGSLEVLRIVASVSVVARHLGPEMRETLPGGLTAMAFLSFVFAMDASRTRADEFVRSRFTRLLVPWAFWCAVYAAVRWARAYPEVPEFWQERSLGMLFVGTNVHLWYLPFAFLFGLLIVAIASRPWARSPWTWLLLLAPTCWAHVTFDGLWGKPTGLWMNALPGLVFAGCLASLDPQQRRDRWLIAFAAAVALGAFVPMHLGGHGLAYFQLFVFPLAAIAWSLRSVAPAGLVDFSKLTYGVYLIHPLAIWLVSRWLARDSFVALAAVCLVSFGATALLRHTPLRRFV